MVRDVTQGTYDVYRRLQLKLLSSSPSAIASSQRDRYLTALVAIQHWLLSDAATDNPYLGMMELLGQASGADRVSVFENHPDALGRVLISVQAEWCKEGVTPTSHWANTQASTLQEYLMYWARLGQDEIICMTTALLPEPERSLWLERQTLAVMILPVIVNDALSGWVSFENCQEARLWEPQEVELLRLAIAALAMTQERRCAMQRSPQPAPKDWLQSQNRLEEVLAERTAVLAHTHRQARQERALNRVVQSIRHSLNLDTVFATAVTEIGKLLQATRTAIVQYIPERQVWLHVAEYRQSPNIASQLNLEVPDRDNPLAAQLKRTEIIQVDDASTLEDDVNRGMAQIFPGAWLMIPLKLGVQTTETSVWGCFAVTREPQSAGWQEWEVEWMRAVTDQLAIAIQQSQLYKQVQRFNLELEHLVQERTVQLRQSLEFESALKRITDKVRDSLDESQILQTVVQELATVLALDCCDTSRYNAEFTTATIAFEATQNMPSAQGKTFPISRYPEIFQQLFQHQCIQVCYLEQPVMRSPEQRFTNLVCPIFDDQGTLGDLCLFKPADATFNDQEVRLVKQVANQCAIAIRQSRLYQAAQAQVEALERLNRCKDDFLSTVSHELRSPVTNMKMAIQVLAMTLNYTDVLNEYATSTAALPDPVAQYLRILDRECDREINLINDLLDLQRLNAGAHQPVLETVDLSFLLSVLVESFQERAQARQQTLQVHLPNPLPQPTSDPVALNRILTELMHNACKYTPPGEKIILTTLAKPQGLCIKITNFGTEIPPDELPRIFEKFYRVPSSDRWQQGGTGLGLALVKQLVQYLQGTIEVRSGKKQTSFLLLLPWYMNPETQAELLEPSED